MRQIGPALERAAELAACHHLLARVTAFFEIDPADRLVIEHLRYKGFKYRMGHGGNTTAHLAPGPLLGCQGCTRRGRGSYWCHPQRAWHTVGGIKVDDRNTVQIG